MCTISNITIDIVRPTLDIGVPRIQMKVKDTIYYSTWRLVTYVLRRTSRPPSPRQHIAGPSLDIDLLKAEIGGEAGLGTADVADHC